MPIDFAAVREGRASYQDATRDLTPSDLRALTTGVFDAVEGNVAGATDRDVVFAPDDPAAHDAAAAPGAAGVDEGWTLGHVVAHLTAGLEEMAAQGATLARGVQVEGRSRYETPWETVQTARQVRDRLAESRRMCLAFRDAWPDAPHLDLTATPIPPFGPLDAVLMAMIGVFHADGHLDQLREIMRQARAARKAG